LVHSLTDKDTLLSLYTMSYKIRLVESEIAREYPKGEMRCPVHLSVGQELTSAVFSFFQKKLDYAVSTHRAHAHYIAKRGDIKAMLSEIYGKATGCSQGRGGSMHLSDSKVRFMGSSAIVGNSIPVGVGIAYGLKLHQQSSRVYIFLGDAATEEGVFFESLNFAVLHHLPIIFVCENNKYSVYTGINDRQPKNRSITDLVRAFGVQSYFVEFGNLHKAFEVFSRATSAQGDFGPQFIEVETYRWLEHCGPNSDDDLAYRPKGELERYIGYDIIAQLETLLMEIDKSADVLLREIDRELQQEISEAFAYAKKSPFPDISMSVGDYYGGNNF
jgi:TPP-dependent pyruvate/acetoin dehydrogenase alpha subunit